MTHPQIARALRLMNMAKNGTPTAAQFEALLTDPGRLDACIELMRRPGAVGQIAGYPNLMAAIFGTEAAMLTLINSQPALDAIFAKPDVKSAFLASTALAKASVPVMTSNTEPFGVASSSSMYGATNSPVKAFDGDANSFWAAGGGLTTNQWVQYEFPSPAFIFSSTVKTYEAQFSPKMCRWECSANGVDYITAKQVLLTPAATTTNAISMAGFYKYWRLFVENTYGSYPAVHMLGFNGFYAP